MKSWIVKNKTLLLGVGICFACYLVALVCQYSINKSIPVSATVGDRELPIYCVEKEEKQKPVPRVKLTLKIRVFKGED